MLRPYRLFLGHGQGDLNHTADLAQVTRPGMAAEQRQHFLAQTSPLCGFTMLLPQAFEQCLLVVAFTQRWQFQGQAADAVIQVLTKSPQLYLFA
ncbi:hypothetical protein D9M71_831800 [compost metagenome]